MSEQRRVKLRQPLKPGQNPNPGPKPQEIKANEVNLPGLKGTLPFSSTTTTIGAHPEVVKAFKEEEEKYQKEAEKVPQGQKFVPPTPVNIDALSDEKFEDIKSAIKDYQEMKPKKPFVPRDPSIGEAMSLAEKASKSTEKVSTPPKAPSVEASPPEAITCTHCGFPTDRRDNTNPDTVDKQVFVAQILGQKRFVKEYSLFGNQFRVVFRSLTTKESDLVIKQLVKDWNDGKITGPASSLAEATKYQMILALESLDSVQGLINLQTLDEYDYEEKDIEVGATVLPLVVEHIYSTYLTQETLRRAIYKAYGHFLDTVSKLEVMAEHDSFWQATGG